MDRFQIRQFIVVHIDGNRKEKTGVASINELVIVVFDEIRVLFVAGRHKPMNFRFNADLFRLGSRIRTTPATGGCGRNVPFAQSSLSLTILQQKEANLNMC